MRCLLICVANARPNRFHQSASRFMAKFDTATVAQIFNLPQRKRKPDMNHHGHTYYLGERLEISAWMSQVRDVAKRAAPAQVDLL
jgi:23S rRNA pseudoU1915 N3-methylase RlmH